MADHQKDIEPLHEKEEKEKQKLTGKQRVLNLIEPSLFTILFVLFEAFIITIYAVWFDYIPFEEAEFESAYYFDMIRDISLMVFIGFGFLMTFPRRYGYSAVGMTFLFTAFVIQWSIICQAFFEAVDDQFFYFSERYPIGYMHILNGIFCGASFLISFGAILGKVTPLQLLVMTIIEPVFFWLNFFICEHKLHAFDIGGGYYIHIYGCYFGLCVCFFLTNKKVLKHPDGISSYTSDMFAFIGTLFLWLYWPSFNAVLGATGLERVRGTTNTYLSLTGATITTFVVSRVTSGGKFDVVHVQNATLAGGVVMGIAAHLEIYPATAIGMGFVAGLISTLGFRFLTPFLSKYCHIHDTCGINNLHGMPGILGAILSIFASLVISQTKEDYIPEYHHGAYQPLIQFAALGITLAISLIAGILTGIILLILSFVGRIHHTNYFHDREFWEIPSDYDPDYEGK